MFYFILSKTKHGAKLLNKKHILKKCDFVTNETERGITTNFPNLIEQKLDQYLSTLQCAKICENQKFAPSLQNCANIYPQCARGNSLPPVDPEGDIWRNLVLFKLVKERGKKDSVKVTLEYFFRKRNISLEREIFLQKMAVKVTLKYFFSRHNSTEIQINFYFPCDQILTFSRNH